VSRVILFEDDFNGDSLSSDWRLRTVARNSVGAESSFSAVSVHDGAVHLKSIKTPGGFVHASIGTSETHATDASFFMEKGFVEARVKFNGWHGAHGSVWLAPQTDYELGQAEVDVVEFFGVHTPKRKSGINFHQNVYYRVPGQGIGEFSALKPDPTPNSTQMGFDPLGWNRFKVRIQPDKFTFYINGKISYIAEGFFPLRFKYLCLSMLTKFDVEVEAMSHGHAPPTMSVDWIRAWVNE
jgi:hypothetical protein